MGRVRMAGRTQESVGQCFEKTNKGGQAGRVRRQAASGDSGRGTLMHHVAAKAWLVWIELCGPAQLTASESLVLAAACLLGEMPHSGSGHGGVQPATSLERHRACGGASAAALGVSRLAPWRGGASWQLAGASIPHGKLDLLQHQKHDGATGIHVGEDGSA